MLITRNPAIVEIHSTQSEFVTMENQKEYPTAQHSTLFLSLNLTVQKYFGRSEFSSLFFIDKKRLIAKNLEKIYIDC